MPKNGKAEVEEKNLDVEHELPAADETEIRQFASGEGAPESRLSEVEKLRAERDTLLDRLARMQAEFDNARKRSAKEQQDFRDRRSYSHSNRLRRLARHVVHHAANALYLDDDARRGGA